MYVESWSVYMGRSQNYSLDVESKSELLVNSW